MPVQHLNHAVLYVRDAARTATFYEQVLGFRVAHRRGDQAVFLCAPGSTNDHDLGVFSIGAEAGDSDAGRRTVGLYHLAWEVDTLAELEVIAEALIAANALVGASNHGASRSLYAKDPDGIEFEVAWFVPEALLREEDRAVTAALPLDLAKAKDVFGATTPGRLAKRTPAGTAHTP